ncbi:class I SAM-dependent methyltransferase [Alcaligenaceae bacterium]|nr:class I SAM-dependent methyltransferase [Alcaligenaceae bacterium]
MNCRHCQHALEHVFLDLGFAPPSNAYLTAGQLNAPETYFPLKLFVCEKCWLVQTKDYARADELFNADYAYFSSTSKGWLAHAAYYTEQMRTRLSLGADSYVIEVASNDGYLLKNFVAAGIPCLGIEPTASTAAAAEALGIPVLPEFFGKTLAQRLAKEGRQADLILGNNVYAHVPDINDFTAGLKAALKADGVITLEFPHLLRLIDENQFDTVYHEHFSYLSLYTVSQIFEHAGLRVWDVERLPTHGGSLRVYGCHDAADRVTTAAVQTLLDEELHYGLRELGTYQAFQPRADKVKNDLLAFLIEQKRAGKSVAAYGAAAKGNTLLNYAGIKPDLLPYVCDAAASKQGKYLPGSHIPILAPAALQDRKPEVVVILPWNIANEVIAQTSFIYDFGGKFVTAVPALELK